MSHRAMRVALWAAALVFPAGSGCRNDPEPLRPALAPPVLRGQTFSPVGRDRKFAKPRTYALLIRLRLITVQLPIGSVSESEDIWSFLNEEPTGARIGAALTLNGLRVGVGVKSAWPDIAKILRGLTGRSLVRSHMLTGPGTTVPFVLKGKQPVQTIFTFRPDRTLVGDDYPPGDNIIAITPTINFDDPTAVVLTGVPLVRSTHRQAKYVYANGAYHLESAPEYRRLPDMEFRVRVPSGGFLLIGPGHDIRRRTSPGHHFLARSARGAATETILVVAPEVFAAPVAPSPR